MSVLTRALRRIEHSQRSAAANETPAPLLVTPKVTQAPSLAPETLAPATLTVFIESPAGHEGLDFTCDPEPTIDLEPTTEEDADREADSSRVEPSPPALEEPPSCEHASPVIVPYTAPPPDPNAGEVVLACDLAPDRETGRSIAASFALEAREKIADDVAIVTLAPASKNMRTSAEDDFVEANEPGLYASHFVVSDDGCGRRRLVLMIDDCRRRFRRTVLLVDRDDEATIHLTASRVDEVVLLGAKGRTPEACLLGTESRLRATAPLLRPRLVVAA